MVIALTIDADFDQDGTYSFDLRDYIDEDSGFTITRGVGADRVMAPATVSLNLKNDSGIFTPGNTTAFNPTPRGKMVRGVKLRIRVTVAPTTWSLFTGRIVDYRPAWGTAPHARMQITAEGNLALLAAAKNLTITGSAARDVDGALAEILTAAGFTSADWTLPDSAQALTWHYNTGGTALEQIRDVMACEMGGLFFEHGDGKFTFIPEHDLCVSGNAAASYVTPIAVWGDNATVATMVPEDVRADYHWDALAAKQRLNHALFVAGSAGTVIYTHPFNATTTPATSQVVAPGGTLWISGTYTAEVSVVTTPVVTTDWTANAAANGSGADRTSDLDLVSFTDHGEGFRMRWQNNNAAAVYLTFFQVRGTNILTNDGTAAIEYELPVAQLPTSIENPEINIKFRDLSVEREAQNLRRLTYSEMRKSRTAWPWVEVDFTHSSDVKGTAIFAREIGQLVRLQDEGTFKSYIDDWFIIQGITHHFSPNKVGMTTFRLKPSHLERTNDFYTFFDTGQRAAANPIAGLIDTAEVGTPTAWANVANWELDANGLIKPTSNTPGLPYIVPSIASGNNGGIAAGVDISGMSGNANAGLWIYGTINGADGCLVFFEYDDDRVALFDRAGGVNTFITAGDWTPKANGRLDVLFQGARVRVFVDGAADPLIDSEAYSIPASPNYAGLYFVGTTVRPGYKHPYFQRL